jgi:hypothetical protein
VSHCSVKSTSIDTAKPDGEEGPLAGTTVLLLTTTGRNSGEKRTTPLIY